MCLTIASLNPPTPDENGKFYRWKLMFGETTKQFRSFYNLNCIWAIGKIKNATPKSPVITTPSNKFTNTPEIGCQIGSGAIHVYSTQLDAACAATGYTYSNANTAQDIIRRNIAAGDPSALGWQAFDLVLVKVQVYGYIATGTDCDEAWKRARIVEVVQNYGTYYA